VARKTDRWPVAVRKVDGTKIRLPEHLIESSEGLDYAPSEKARRTVTVQEPVNGRPAPKAPRTTTQPETPKEN
jgi:hypothetical protein